ncbi:MAG: DUF4375 domain-containing protein [Pseudomonadota bacterium]
MGLFSRIISARGAPSTPPIVLDEALVTSTGDYPFHDCVQSVVNYVNDMGAQAFYRMSELSAKTAQVYETDRYYAQVLNGGHKQYLHNVHGQHATMAPHVAAGLKAMRAKPFAACHRKFLAAIEEFGPEAKLPDPTMLETMFDRIDTEFFKADEKRKLVEYSAEWIRSWRYVDLCSRDDLPTRYAELATENPFLSTRREAAEVAKFAGWFTNDMMVGAGLLLAELETMDMLESIQPGKVVPFGPGPYGSPAMRLKTALGSYYAVYMHDLLTLHEEADTADVATESQRRKAGDVSQPGDDDWGDRRFLDQGIGRQVSMTVPELVQQVIEKTTARHVPLACHDLFKAAGIDAPVTQVGWIGGQTRILIGKISWLMRAGDMYYTLIMTPEELRLFQRDSDVPIARIDATTLEKRGTDLQD